MSTSSDPIVIDDLPGDESQKRHSDEEIMEGTKRIKLQSPLPQTEKEKELERLLREKLNEEELADKDRQKAVAKAERERQKAEREQQRAEKERLREERERLKEEARAAKAEEKRLKEQEKAAKAEERRLKQAEKEREKEERRRKAEEEKEERRRKAEEERLDRERKKEERERERLEKKRKQEEEKLRREEEKRRQAEAKERAQKKISMFFQVKKTAEPKEEEAVSRPTGDSVYEQVFLPFYQKSNVEVTGAGSLDPAALEAARHHFDQLLHQSIGDVRELFGPVEHVEVALVHPEDIVAAVNGEKTNEAAAMVQQLRPVKYLQFYENKRPPYIGTWSSRAHTTLVGGPLHIIEGVDYDYDSDIEWNGDEDEEGEDVENDDDDDDDDDMEEEDEMDNFVESTDDRRRKVIGPLVSVSVWNDGSLENVPVFQAMSIQMVDLRISFPIDPNRDYWLVGVEALPRVVKQRTIQDGVVKYQLSQFIEKNNDFTLGTLVELAKKDFKSFTKTMLKHTIQDMAVYNKKLGTWEVRPEVREALHQVHEQPGPQVQAPANPGIV